MIDMARAIFGSNSQTSNPTPGNIPGGTFGGRKIATGSGPGMKLMVGDEGYLWLLVGAEALTMWYLRKKFRRHHGG